MILSWEFFWYKIWWIRMWFLYFRLMYIMCQCYWNQNREFNGSLNLTTDQANLKQSRKNRVLGWVSGNFFQTKVQSLYHKSVQNWRKLYNWWALKYPHLKLHSSCLWKAFIVIDTELTYSRHLLYQFLMVSHFSYIFLALVHWYQAHWFEGRLITPPNYCFKSETTLLPWV